MNRPFSKISSVSILIVSVILFPVVLIYAPSIYLWSARREERTVERTRTAFQMMAVGIFGLYVYLEYFYRFFTGRLS